jgi:DNA-binding protein HU-beta
LNKKELVEKITQATKLNKTACEKALVSTIAAITGSLAKGEAVTLIGFGTFSVTKRNAREGRNPQDGKTIKIPARKVAKFKAGNAFTQAINS